MTGADGEMNTLGWLLVAGFLLVVTLAFMVLGLWAEYKGLPQKWGREKDFGGGD